MSFIHEDFMLQNEVAKRLYHEYAEKLPIIDYHCHLSPKEIAENHRFSNVTELMLGGDHYKWRAMRSAGVEEDYITGTADPREKFRKWAWVVSLLIGNPLYHWTHLELKRYFGIDKTLSPETADEMYDICNERLKEDAFCAQELIRRSGVEALCTTDDPLDDLAFHKELAGTFPVKVLPTFRPDKAIHIDRDTFLPYMERTGVKTLDALKSFMLSRLDYFQEAGCRLADHGLDDMVPYAEGDAAEVFKKARAGEVITAQEAEIYKTDMSLFFGKEYAKRGWVMQLHIGAMRNNNTVMFHKLGPDAGFDSLNDNAIARPLSRLLDGMEREDLLPKTILYTLHPKDNYVLGTMLGNFQKAPHFGKIQFGSGWWFNDQRDGMEAQMRSLANLGMLASFVGMLTDSRSLLSYPRHEYFRRILCNLIGTWVVNGEFPEDDKQLRIIVEGICYKNAKKYFSY